MKSLPILILFFFSAIGFANAQKFDTQLRIQELLDQRIAKGQFAGGVVGIRVGEQSYTAASGYRDLKSELLFEQHTLNRIASISKSMTAVAALQLYEQGVLDLDEPIQTYLPNYPSRHASRITTRQLLLHSSGIGGYESGKEAQNEQEYTSLTEAATVFQDRDLVDEPGNAEHYSTYNYVVLDMVIEAVSGQSFEDYMEEHIWGAIDMENTGVEHLSESYENKSSVYYRTKKGKVKLSKTNNLTNRIPGGGFYSTVDDLLSFGHSVIHHQLVNESTFEMMMEKPGLPYEGNPYGMGWFLYGENSGGLGQVYGHTGEQTGCSAVLLILPEVDATVVVMTNTALALNDAFGLELELLGVLKEMKQLQEKN
ncbi:MAG: serine hydrolase domain-containing protein [Bacteroidota bacterium]